MSCSAGGISSDAAAEDYPDMVLTGANYTFKQEDNDPLVLNADKITIWDGNRTNLEGVKFSQKKDGETELWGTCDTAQAEDNSKIMLSGNVQLFKKTDNISIVCSDLEWDDDVRRLHSDGVVAINYQDGTSITGKGFNAQLDSNEYSFERIIEGHYTDE